MASVSRLLHRRQRLVTYRKLKLITDLGAKASSITSRMVERVVCCQPVSTLGSVDKG